MADQPVPIGSTISTKTPALGMPVSELSEASESALLSQSAAHLVALATNDVVWDRDIVRNTLKMGASARKILRCEPGENIDDMAWWESHIHPADAGGILGDIGATLAGTAQTWAGEYRLRRGDGTYAYVYDRGFISRDASGKALRMVGSMLDITDRKVAEQAVGDSERRFRSLIENATDAICIINGEGRFTYASESYRRVLGFAPEELVGRDIFDFVHKDDIPRAIESFKGITEGTGRSLRTQFRCKHKDGTWRIIESTSHNLMHDPAVGGVVAASRDVTHEHTLQAELIQAQKMEAVGQLAGGIAHDFNNLLTVISTNSELSLSGIPKESPAHEQLLEIRRAAAQASSLTRRLLTFTSRRSGETQIVDLNEVVSDSQAILRRVVGEDVQLHVTLAPRAPLVLADRSQLEQVVMNLVVNSRDALPEGGVIEITTGRTEIGNGVTGTPAGAPPGEYAVLEVRDTGLGMDEATRARAFEPFFTTKETGKGTGLGLSMVYGIIKQAGGHIFMETSQREGTTFRILIPRMTGARPTPPEGQTAIARSEGTETVLLVEDEDAVRRVVRRTLQSQGYSVLEATNGIEALAIAESSHARISLVLTDVIMPGMGGPELARELGERFPQLKVVFLSGYAPDTVTTHGSLPVGATLIEKPFAIETLLAKVRLALDGDGAVLARE